MKSGNRIIQHIMPDEKIVMPEFTDRSHVVQYHMPYHYLKIDLMEKPFNPAPVIDWFGKVKECIDACES